VGLGSGGSSMNGSLRTGSAELQLGVQQELVHWWPQPHEGATGAKAEPQGWGQQLL
jgi:hypothetical protein